MYGVKIIPKLRPWLSKYGQSWTAKNRDFFRSLQAICEQIVKHNKLTMDSCWEDNTLY